MIIPWLVVNSMVEYKKLTVRGLSYQIGNNGEIVGPNGKILKQRLNSDGYMCVTVGSNKSGRTTMRVHRLVALAFIDNPDNLPEVNHIDFNRMNNYVKNLEWATHMDNVRHSSDVGHYNNKSGVNNGRAKSNATEVNNIRKLYTQGLSISNICSIFNKPYSTIFNIVHYKTWKN